MVFSCILSILFLLPLLSSAVQFWNIDCGATDGFSDLVNLTWVGDGEFVKAGESRVIPNTTGVVKTDTTLRVFPKNNKNCYSIPVGKGKKVMVLVRFYYGNYDGLGKPPSFELMFEGHDWTEVTTSRASGKVISVIYVTKRAETSVCFGKTEADQVPFVSSIVLRTLDPEVYAEVNSSYVLYSPWRFALGANQTIRYPDDPYDRRWYPIDTSIDISNYTIARSNTSTIYASRSIDNPPTKMFDTAIVPQRGAKNLTMTLSFLFILSLPVYLNMYFSEVSMISKEKRAFHIYMDDVLISKEFGPIIPPFGNVLEFSSATLVGVTSSSRLTLVPTADSALPPLINGLEILFIHTFPNGETNPVDVDALTKLQNSFPSLQEWTGDPCLPYGYKWEWVGCGSNETPRIKKLFLGSYGLSGSLPDFSELTALEILDLHNNSLSGSIPEFLGNLPNLKELNLANNKFDSIPTSVFRNRGIKLNITGNPAAEEAPPPSPVTGSSPDSPSNGCIRDVHVPTFLLHLLLLMIGFAT